MRAILAASATIVVVLVAAFILGQLLQSHIVLGPLCPPYSQDPLALVCTPG